MFLSKIAWSFGLRLRVEEMDMEGLANDMKRGRKRGGSEWLAFNCVVGLPYMERRSFRHVQEFLKLAKEYCSSNKGMLTFAIGNDAEKWRANGFGSLFELQIVHFQTLMESMEQNFPVHFTEARIVMEY
ncbi:hypothetical protein SLE2022_286310 [Rubroshorea leprosula]